MCNHDQTIYMPIYATDYRIGWNKRIYPAEIDACLAPILYKIHKQGIKTEHCCCRHGQPLEEYEGHITIEKQSVKLAISLGYKVTSYWRTWKSEYDGQRQFEIVLPNELIGKSNFTLEESNQVKYDYYKKMGSYK